jgi:hypothetical protein
MEIEINNTPDTKDDLVKLKCQHPAHLWSVVDCRIRSTDAPGEGSATVVLTNPDGRLRFPGPDDKTTTLSVPKNGSWVSFQISGEAPSKALGDAVIEAHCSTNKGEVKASKKVTVFWFDQAKIEIKPGGAYVRAGKTYKPQGGNAVDYSAQARIRPAGVDCSAPQVKNLRVGIMQNTVAPTLIEQTWSGPKVKFYASAAPGTKVNQAMTVKVTKSINVAGNDTDASVRPLYDQPVEGGSKDSLKPPIGCAGGAAAKSNDSPNLSVREDEKARVDAFSVEGKKVGGAYYSELIRIRQNSKFITWAVLFDTETKDFCALRQSTWSLNVDSSATTVQKAEAADADTDATTTPVTEPETADLFDKPGSVTSAPVGEEVKEFTK